MVVCFGSINVRIHEQAVHLQREGNPEEEWGVGWGVMTTKKAALCGQLELNPAACHWQPGQRTWWIYPIGGTRPVGVPALVPVGDWLLPGGIHFPLLPGSTRAGKRALKSRESPQERNADAVLEIRPCALRYKNTGIWVGHGLR